MHMIIDILAGIVLLSFFLAGWHKGLLLSLLGVGRGVVAYAAAYFSGRYLGFWLGEFAHRPRIVTIPVCAGLAFTLVIFTFHLVMHRIRAGHAEKVEKDDFHHPLGNCLCGGAINLAAGTLSLVLAFWLGDLFLVGVAGTSIPGSDQAYFSRFARRTLYEIAYFAIPKHGHEQQVASIAHMISTPADAIHLLETVIAADSVQQLVTDPTFARDLLSGDSDRIQRNTSIQRVFDDRATLDALRDLGLLSGKETRTGLCEKLSAVGSNERIQASIESLRNRGLLNTDKIPLLLRDPEFDIIVAELVK